MTDRYKWLNNKTAVSVPCKYPSVFKATRPHLHLISFLHLILIWQATIKCQNKLFKFTPPPLFFKSYLSLCVPLLLMVWPFILWRYLRSTTGQLSQGTLLNWSAHITWTPQRLIYWNQSSTIIHHLQMAMFVKDQRVGGWHTLLYR